MSSSTGTRKERNVQTRSNEAITEADKQFIDSFKIFTEASNNVAGLAGSAVNNSPKTPAGNYLAREGDSMIGPLALGPPLDFDIEVDANNTIDIGPLNENPQYSSNLQLDDLQPNSSVLDIIANAAFDGQKLVLRTFAPTTPYTISQGTVGNGGNIQTGDGNDLTVGDLQVVELIFDESLIINANTGGTWRVQSVSSGGAGGLSEPVILTVNTITPQTLPTTSVIDWSKNPNHITIDRDVEFSFSNLPASGSYEGVLVIIDIDGTGGYAAPIWPAAVPNPPIVPTTANTRTSVMLYTIDGGTVVTHATSVGSSSVGPPFSDAIAIVKDEVDATKLVQLNASLLATGTTALVNFITTVSRSYTFPDINGIVILDQGTQRIEGLKDFDSGSLLISNPANTFEYAVAGSAITADRIITLPLLTGNDTFLCNDNTATVTNKSLDNTNNLAACSVSLGLSYNNGIRQTFNPNTTVPGINIGSQAGDPSTPINGDMWYNSTTNKFRARENGVDVDMIGGAGGGANQQLSNLSGTVAVNLDLDPDTTNTLDIGNATFRWDEIFVQKLNLSSGANLGATSDITPDIDSTRTLGNASRLWLTVHTDRVRLTTSTNTIFETAGDMVIDANAELQFRIGAVAAGRIVSTSEWDFETATLNGIGTLGFDDGHTLASTPSNLVMNLSTGDEFVIQDNSTTFGSFGEQIGSLTHVDNGAVGYLLRLGLDSASPADSDTLGVIEFYGNDSLSNLQPFADIAGGALDVTSGTEDGFMNFNVQNNGSSARVLQVSASGGNVNIGFFGVTASSRPDITGSRGGNAALADLLTKLATLGLITDSTT